MAFTKQLHDEIAVVLKDCIRRKFQSYKPEPADMPFHTRLLGKDRLALYAFIHSLNTNFGTSVFEPVARSVAKIHFPFSEVQQTVGTHISTQAQRIIQDIMDSLSSADKAPDHLKEIELIRKVCHSGEMRQVKPTKIDLMLKDSQGKIYLVDIKTAKPNAGGFKEFKRTLLEWTAISLATNPDMNIQAFIAIPYNPYEPKPYTRWTIRGMLDLDHELKVASEFWDFLGGDGAYQSILDIFEQVGLELRTEIDEFFSRFLHHPAIS